MSVIVNTLMILLKVWDGYGQIDKKFIYSHQQSYNSTLGNSRVSKKVKSSNTYPSSVQNCPLQNNQNTLGQVSAKHESGFVPRKENGKILKNKNGKPRLKKATTKSEKAAIISSGKGDPGGKSYGVYQLASSKDTLSKFINNLPHKYKDDLKNAGKPGSLEFDEKWQELAETDGDNFYDMQHKFIEETHYQPALKYAKDKGFDTSQPGLQEAIFSASVQHGGVNQIADRVANKNDLATMNAEEQINAYYDERSNYVKEKMKTKNQDEENVKKNILENRYPTEREDALKIQYDYEDKN